MKYLPFSLSLVLFIWGNTPSVAQQDDQLAAKVRKSLEQGIAFFHSIAIEGGYVYHYTPDLKETWGEGRTDQRTIEVQPPGTPAVGMSFLRAYRITGNPAHLEAARDAAFALIRGQNDLGGWEHKIYFDRPKGKMVSFDDDQTQSAISFLMALDRETDDPGLTEAVEMALNMMLTSQLDNGGWPHRFPWQGNYHDYATFNDEGINDCIRVMLEAHRQYGKEEYLASLQKVGRFLMISQLPPPQPGWAQQYNEYLQPAWARSFEPAAVCPAVTIRNLHSLMDLYLHLGRSEYLEAIPDPIRWLHGSRLPNGKWGRFLEIGTNKPLYYDRGRIRVDSLHQLSLERRSGYGYENDLSQALEAAEQRFKAISEEDFSSFPATMNSGLSSEEKAQLISELEPKVREIIASQDAKGRWITRDDKFRQDIDVRKWNGEYRIADRISSRSFNENIAVLCQYLELLK